MDERLEVAVEIVGGRWDSGVDWAALARRAVAATLAAQDLADGAVEVAVRFSDDAEVAALNRAWRCRDGPTNILSFPMQAKALAGVPLLLGDLVLADGVVLREAAERCIAPANHVTHLIVHGTLHLVGHDHQDDPQAEAMEALEVRLLAGLGIADPYRPAAVLPDG